MVETLNTIGVMQNYRFLWGQCVSRMQKDGIFEIIWSCAHRGEIIYVYSRRRNRL